MLKRCQSRKADRPACGLLAAMVLAGAALPWAGCTSGAVSASEASTVDVFFGTPVQRYIKQREAELVALQARATDLDDELLLKLGQLHAMERELAALEQSEAQSAQRVAVVQADLREARRKAEQAQAKAQDAATNVDDLRQWGTTRQAVGAEEVDQRQRDIEAQIAAVEQENQTLEQAIERSLRVRVEQLKARESSTLPT